MRAATTAGTTSGTGRPTGRAALPACLVLTFAAALLLRVAVGGSTVTTSLPAGLAFAAVLGLVAAAFRPVLRPAVGWSRACWFGVGGAAVLCLPAALTTVLDPSRQTTGSGYLMWSAAVIAVVLAEEAFLRGAVYQAVEAATADRWDARRGQQAALAVTAVLFAVGHVPLYGWSALPLDLAVGVWLGVLRAASGSFLAPTVAHLGADLAGWWLG